MQITFTLPGGIASCSSLEAGLRWTPYGGPSPALYPIGVANMHSPTFFEVSTGQPATNVEGCTIGFYDCSSNSARLTCKMTTSVDPSQQIYVFGVEMHYPSY